MNDDKKSALKKPLTSPVQVSNAPPPIEPLRGFGGSFRTSSRRAAAKLPNWNYWKTMDEVAIWQACALALDIDPESMTPHPQSWMAPGSDIFTEDSFTSNEQSDSFNKLSRRLNQSLSNKQHFTYAWNHHTCNPAVHLSEFAAWCVRIGQDIPQELAAMAKAAQQATPTAKVEAVAGTTPSDDAIPGNMPHTAIGKLAIKAAWQIERKTGKRATNKQVIEKLQTWVDHKDNPEAVSELTNKIPNGVKWVTCAGKENNYDVGACQKTLEKWNKSRA